MSCGGVNQSNKMWLASGFRGGFLHVVFVTILLTMLTGLGRGYSTNDILENATRPAKVKAFVACRKECIQRCDTLVYRFERNQYHCHKCLGECMRLFLKQAQSVGVEFGSTGGDKKRKRKRKAGQIDKNNNTQ